MIAIWQRSPCLSDIICIEINNVQCFSFGCYFHLFLQFFLGRKEILLHLLMVFLIIKYFKWCIFPERQNIHFIGMCIFLRIDKRDISIQPIFHNIWLWDFPLRAFLTSPFALQTVEGLYLFTQNMDGLISLFQFLQPM